MNVLLAAAAAPLTRFTTWKVPVCWAYTLLNVNAVGVVRLAIVRVCGGAAVRL